MLKSNKHISVTKWDASAWRFHRNSVSWAPNLAQSASILGTLIFCVPVFIWAPLSFVELSSGIHGGLSGREGDTVGELANKQLFTPLWQWGSCQVGTCDLEQVQGDLGTGGWRLNTGYPEDRGLSLKILMKTWWWVALWPVNSSLLRQDFNISRL